MDLAGFFWVKEGAINQKLRKKKAFLKNLAM